MGMDINKTQANTPQGQPPGCLFLLKEIMIPKNLPRELNPRYSETVRTLLYIPRKIIVKKLIKEINDLVKNQDNQQLEKEEQLEKLIRKLELSIYHQLIIKSDPSRLNYVPKFRRGLLGNLRPILSQRFPKLVKDSNVLYKYFTPSHHFKTGLVTAKHIKQFQEDSGFSMLSVGAGPAFLEKVLKKLGLKNILISDFDNSDLPKSFERVLFDTYGDWSKVEQLENKKFNLIIFPESVLCNIQGFMRKDQSFTDPAKNCLKVINSALAFLKPGGEMRINGHGLKLEELEAVRQKLTKDHTELKFESNKDLIVVAKL